MLPGWRRKYFVKRRRNWKHNSAVDSSSISQEDLHGREKLNTPNQTTMDKTTSLPTSTSFPGIVSCHPGMNGIYQSITMPGGCDGRLGRRSSILESDMEVWCGDRIADMLTNDDTTGWCSAGNIIDYRPVFAISSFRSVFPTDDDLTSEGHFC